MPNYGPKIIIDGLVFHIDAQKSYPLFGTTVKDISKSKINGEFGGNVSFQDGFPSYFDFDGSTDYINFGTAPQLDMSTQISLCAWVWFDSKSSNGHILGKSNYNNGYIIHYDAAYETRAGGGFQFTNVLGSAWECGVDIDINKWYYLTYTYNGFNERFYLNGQVKALRSVTSSVVDTVGKNFYLGYATSDCINGKIATASIYNRALNSNEVLQNYNALKGRFGL